jgi:SHS2 domain-containing protein
MVHAYYSGIVETRPPSEQFGHGADVGVRGRGATPEEAFAGAALALEALFARDPASVRPVREATVTSRAADLEGLLVDFLDELIFVFATRRLVFSRFDIGIEEGAPGDISLRAKAFGERWDPSRHEATVEPKGATFTALRVGREGGGWVAQCVVDV